MMTDAPNEREAFYDGLNADLLQVFDEENESSEEFKFPLSYQARKEDEGSHRTHILGEAGRGGMKVIYQCRVVEDGKIIAFAVIRDKSDPDSVESFLREAKITQKLKHKNIIRVYDFGINERHGPYIAMNFVNGESLAEVLKLLSENDENTADIYTLKRRLEIFRDVAGAVNYAHLQGVVHLDLKPENILIDKNGCPYVCDWEMARVLPEFEDGESELIAGRSLEEIYFKGSPGYMAPEQAVAGKGDRLTDIYQLGALLYALVFLRPPVEGDTPEEILKNTVQGQIKLPSKDDSTLLTVMEKALSTDPQERFQNVQEIIDLMEKNIFSHAGSGKSQKWWQRLLFD